MSTLSLNSITAAQPQPVSQNTSNTIQTAITGLVNAGPQAPADTTTVSQSGQVQSSQDSGLKKASVNLAQGSSLAQVAGNATSQIDSLLQQLALLADEAQSESLDTSERDSLNQQFESLAAQLDQVAGGTSFAGQALLDGTLSDTGSLSLSGLISGDGASAGSGADTSLSIPDLQTNALFGGQSLDLASPQDAQNASAAIDTALGTVGSVQSDIGSFQQATDLAGATVDTILANQQASQSTLSESDFGQINSPFSQANLPQNAASAVAAQTTQLNPALLALITA